MAEAKTKTKQEAAKPAVEVVEYTIHFTNGDRRVFRAEKGTIFGNRWVVAPAGNGFPETAYPTSAIKAIEVRKI